jgi:hypothetical protein
MLKTLIFATNINIYLVRLIDNIFSIFYVKVYYSVIKYEGPNMLKTLIFVTNINIYLVRLIDNIYAHLQVSRGCQSSPVSPIDL